MSDEDLAQGVEIGARGAARYGLGYVLNKQPEKAAQISEGAALAAKLLRENVIPAFSGASTEEVLRSVVDTALEEISEQLTPQVVLAIQLALDVISVQVKLPENRADRLTPRTRMALLGLFTGLAEGLDEGSSIAPTRDEPPVKLFWP